MKKAMFLVLFCIYLITVPSIAKEAEKNRLEIDKIEELTGLKGSFIEEEEVFKITVPREDLNVLINNVKIPPSAGVSSWMSFKKADGKAMVMGDLILTEEQVYPVMTAVLNNGLWITALHNHFLWETPRVMFMHIEGIGGLKELSEAIGKVFAAMKEPRAKNTNTVYPKIDSSKTSISTEKIDSILKSKGTLDGGVYKFVVGREAKVDCNKIGKSMGINTWAAFMGTDNEAMVVGDFVVRKNEMQKVIAALVNAKINVVSIHQHMVDARPQYFFIHFYGFGEAESLAKGLQLALDQTKYN